MRYRRAHVPASRLIIEPSASLEAVPAFGAHPQFCFYDFNLNLSHMFRILGPKATYLTRQGQNDATGGVAI